VAPPYDALTPDERHRLRDLAPDSFLHALPTASHPGAVTNAELAHNRTSVERLRASAFVPVPRPFVAIYRLSEGDRAQTGLIVDLDVDALGTVVAGHEHTHAAREDDLVRYLETVGAQSSPVCLTHAPLPELAAALAASTTDDPTVALVQDGATEQELWVVDDEDAVASLLAVAGGVARAVITDGHHRAAAAARFAAGRDGAGRHVLVALFPADEIRVTAFHRVVRPPLPVHPADLAAALRHHGLEVRPTDGPFDPQRPGHVGLLAAGRWWEVGVPATRLPDDAVDASDVWLLQREVLAPVLEVADPRTDPRLEHLPTSLPLASFTAAVGRDGVGFLLRPPSVEVLLAAGEHGRVLPPKSTYVHPKARSGLLLVPRDG
jgi:uncharacterized protein (DUF1015 family)